MFTPGITVVPILIVVENLIVIAVENLKLKAYINSYFVYQLL